MASDTEIAWAAGLFEGEGTFDWHGCQIRVTMSLTDLDVLQRFASIVGNGTISGPIKRKDAKPHWKPCWHWWAIGQNVVTICFAFLPYLGQRRSAKAREVLAKFEAYLEAVAPVRPCEHCGLPFKPRSRRAASKAKYCEPRCLRLAKNERRRNLHAARQPLTPQRRVFLQPDKIARTVEFRRAGLTEREIAARLECSRGAVRYRLELAGVLPVASDAQRELRELSRQYREMRGLIR